MKNFRKLGSMLTVSMFLFVFTFFTPKSILADSKKSHYPVTVTTYNYEKQPVEEVFKKVPERVLAYAQDNVETMLALGLEKHIVLATGLDHPVKDEFKKQFEGLKYLEKLPSKEDVLALNPDLIMGWFSSFSDKRLGDVNFWHERGINTLMALNSGLLKPQTLENEYTNILNIGKIFDVEDKAEIIVENMRNKIKDAEELSKNREKVKCIIVEVEKDGVYRVYGSKTIGGNVASLVGAELVGDTDKKLGVEDLIAANPDVLFTVYYAEDIGEEQSIKLILDNPALSSINAVKNKRVHAMKLSEVYSSGIRSLDCIETIVSGLYPEK